ncbi:MULTISPECIES: GAF domain-containing sensor histidine kinase [Luteimonas]|uniref:GAF domain-containing sensor histidine kinase n=1 Tax=Luteimonas TaxID=83614 RepID=UPI000C7BA4A5|nr:MULTISPECIES: GAF domain-containing protein [Luteimonas]
MHDTHQTQRDVEAVGRIAAVPRILEVVARTTGLRFAAVARVTESRWTACAVHDELDFGLQSGGELDVRTTICDEIRQHQQPVAFGQASTHPQFSTHRTPQLYGLESYISVPIFRASGEFFGTLCAIDPRPSRVDDPDTIRTLELFAQLIGLQLESDEKFALSQAALHTALDVAKLRERFIRDVSEDFREPIQAVIMETYLIKTGATLDTDTRERVGRIEEHIWQMSSLLDDIVDFAHDKLAAGLPLAQVSAAALSAELQRVLSQVVTAHPDRAFASAVRIHADVDCDPPRIGQLLVNLVLNVVRHDDTAQTVAIDVGTTADALVLRVGVAGLALPDGLLDTVAGPLPNPSGDARRTGWDFFIAGEIARAHGGRIDAVQIAGGGELVFTMPLRVSVAVPAASEAGRVDA